ncbi:MAG TPA: magnesium chelatase domain-containing protein [Candidatus Saccharimonadales bacterium]|jgi:predicted ATPase with chaperone activity
MYPQCFCRQQPQPDPQTYHDQPGPADVPKDGSGFDLGVATAILAACGQARNPLASTAILGELNLSDDVGPIRGIIGKILAGKQHGLKSFIIPAGNLEQAVLVSGVTLVAVKTLAELHKYLNDASLTTPVDTDQRIEARPEDGKPWTDMGLEDVIA